MKANAPTIIKRLREEKGYTQEYLGQRIGVNKATINRYETGEIDIKRTIAIKLASVLDVTPSQIMGWHDEYATAEERTFARYKTNKIMTDNNIFTDDFVKILNEKGIDISGVSFRAWCNGEIPFFAEIDDFKILASALGISLNDLLGRTYAPETNDTFSIGTPYNPVIHKIPILGRIAAGLPLYAEEHIEGYTYTEHNGGAEYFALKVKGDSMNAAYINDGSMIIVRRQPEVDNGQIAVVKVDKDDATVKRFRKDGNIVQLIPQSYNPEHQIQIYDLKNTEVEVIGKVVECKVEF